MGGKSLKKKDKCLELEKKLDEYKETLQRLQAEFENFQKRTEKEKGVIVDYGNAALIKELLPVIESLENCIEKMQSEEDRKGIMFIERQLKEVLGKKGLKEINALGQKFDPHLHEAMMNGCEKDKEDYIVLEEFQKGYMLRDRVLRPAKVKINKLEEK